MGSFSKPAKGANEYETPEDVKSGVKGTQFVGLEGQGFQTIAQPHRQHNEFELKSARKRPGKESQSLALNLQNLRQ